MHKPGQHSFRSFSSRRFCIAKRAGKDRYQCSVVLGSHRLLRSMATLSRVPVMKSRRLLEGIFPVAFRESICQNIRGGCLPQKTPSPLYRSQRPVDRMDRKEERDTGDEGCPSYLLRGSGRDKAEHSLRSSSSGMPDYSYCAITNRALYGPFPPVSWPRCRPPHIVRTTRNSALPLNMRAYAPAAFSKG